MSVAEREAAHLAVVTAARAQATLEPRIASQPLILPAALSLPTARVDQRKGSWTPERRAQASRRMTEENWKRFCEKWRPFCEET